MKCCPRYIYIIKRVVASPPDTHMQHLYAYTWFGGGGGGSVPCFHPCNEDWVEEWIVGSFFSGQIKSNIFLLLFVIICTLYNRIYAYHQHLCLVRKSKI